MSHEPDEQELLELVHALQAALWRCYAWRDAPAYVAGIALTAINDSDDVLSGYDFDEPVVISSPRTTPPRRPGQ